MTGAGRHGGSRSRRLAVAAAIVVGLAGAFAPSPLARPARALGVLANPDTLSTRHDRTSVVAAPGVLANDVTILGTTAVLVSGTSHGAVNLAADGGYTYQPTAGFVGADAFRYRDSGVLTNTVLATITVTNTAPVAVDDWYAALTAVTLTVPAPGVLADDEDADGDVLRASLVDGGGNGSLSLASNGAFTFKSGGSFSGIRTFTYRVSDGVTSSAVATVSINVGATTPSPTPSPAPVPSPTPTPTLPLPTLPLPTLPLPTLPLPTLPLPTLPVPDPTRPSATPSVDPSRAPGASATADPSAARPSDVPTGSGPIGGASSGGPGGSTGGGLGDSGTGEDPLAAGFSVGSSGGRSVAVGLGAHIGGFDAIVDFAVPGLVLTVPGLLLIFAVLAQGLVGAVWLPFARRWLGGFGLRRRRPSPR